MELPRGRGVSRPDRRAERARAKAASPAQGGAYHEGGVIFTSPSDDGYVAISDWAREHGRRRSPTTTRFRVLLRKVQPMLVKKGCMMVQCHSASMFHDFRLHGGSSGSFSLSATRKNYELSLAQLARRERRHRTRAAWCARISIARGLQRGRLRQAERHRASRRSAPRGLR